MKLTAKKQFTALAARPLPERPVVDRLCVTLDQIAEQLPSDGRCAEPLSFPVKLGS